MSSFRFLADVGSFGVAADLPLGASLPLSWSSAGGLDDLSGAGAHSSLDDKRPDQAYFDHLSTSEAEPKYSKTKIICELPGSFSDKPSHFCGDDDLAILAQCDAVGRDVHHIRVGSLGE